jgi:hypothetical protein
MNLKLTIATLLLTLAGSPAMEAGVGAAFARGARRGISRSLVRKMPRTLLRDRVRDLRTPALPLTRPRTVFRYTTRGQATQELKKGIQPNRHMTATGAPGRPLGPGAAKSRYGLPQKPTIRESVHLPKGFPVRHNRALQGKPGVGELTSPKRVPPGAVRKVVPLKPSVPR